MKNWLIKKLGIDRIIKDKVNKTELDKEIIIRNIYQVIEDQIKNKNLGHGRSYNIAAQSFNRWIKGLIKDIHHDEYSEQIKEAISTHMNKLNSEEFIDNIIKRIKDKQLN